MARRQRSERGAVAVEAALVTPILILLVFGIIEMSLLMRDAAGVTNQVRAGARIAATEAASGPSSSSTPSSPTTPSTAVQNAGSSMPLSSVNWVLVYQANQYGYPMPSTNTNSLTCSTNCIKYVWSTSSNKFVRSSGHVGHHHHQRVRQRPQPSVGGGGHVRAAHLDHRTVRDAASTCRPA